MPFAFVHMKIYPEDIRIKNNTCWVSQRLLYVVGMPEEYGWKKRSQFKKSLSPFYQKQLKSKKLNVMPDTGASWRWARWNKQFYYDYDYIPDRAPTYYRSSLPTREECIELYNNVGKLDYEATLKNVQKQIEMEAQFYVDTTDIAHLIYNNGFLSATVADQIVKARALCVAINNNTASYKTLGVTKAADFWHACTDLVKRLDIKGLRIKNPNSLRNKLRNFPETKEEQFKYLISGKYGNNNKRVVGKYQYVDIETGQIFKYDLHEALIYNYWMNPGKPNKLHQTGIAGVYPRYKERIEAYGLDAVSERTVQFYISRFSNKALMSLERDGKDHFTNTYLPYVPQFMPKYTGSLWVADFSGSKILYKDVVTKWNTNTGRKVTKQVIKSHYMCRITDVATGKLIGWSLSEKQGERWEDVSPALRMAYENNHGRMAMELVTDNGGVWKETENKLKLSMLFKKHRPIGLGNKQSNKAEFYVKMLSDIAREFDNWSMLGFNSKHIDNEANPDYMKPANVPSKQEVTMQIEALIEKWNSTERNDGTIPNIEQSKKERLHPKLVKLDPRVYRYCLANTTTTRLNRTRSILNIGKGDTNYKYKLADWEDVIKQIDDMMYGSTDLKVKVCYDKEVADLYTLDGKYIATAKAAELSHSTKFEATDESTRALNNHMAAKAMMKARAMEFTDDVQDVLSAADTIDIDYEPEKELGYLQRAALNNGRAKDENLRIQQELNEDIDIDFLNQL